MYRYLTAFALAGALLAPVALRADDDDRRHVKRYYDPYRRDYHQWNEREERAYRHYLQEQRRRDYHDWRKANREEQRGYWRWRHEHPEWDRDNR
jgi:hypothetical protein